MMQTTQESYKSHGMKISFALKYEIWEICTLFMGCKKLC